MLENDENIEQEEEMDEQELIAPEPVLAPAPEPEPAPAPKPSGSKWDWIGSPSRPEAQEHSDGISDLFTVDDDDLDAGEGVDDLVTVDIERDIMDADAETGDLSDLVDVTEEDIMGSSDYGQPSSRQQRRVAGRRISRQLPPTSLGGMRG